MSFYRTARTASDPDCRHSWICQCLNSTKVKAVRLSANLSAEHKAPLLPFLFSHGRALTWPAQISTPLKWQMFFHWDLCVLVDVCLYRTCMLLCWLGIYLLDIRWLSRMGVKSVLICFNPDDGAHLSPELTLIHQRHKLIHAINAFPANVPVWTVV